MKTFDCLDPSLSLKGYLALEASAGTGKTFAIQHLVARLILQDIPIDQILVVTFTRASTRELKCRIRENLETLFQLSPPYISHLGEEEKLRAHDLINEALTRFDESQIFTIHGFCKRMLSEFGFEAQIDLTSLNEQEESYREILKEEITDFFHTSLPEKSYSTEQLTILMNHYGHDKEKLIESLLQLIEQRGEFPNYPDYQTLEEQYQEIFPTLPKLSLETLLKLSPAFLKICNREGSLKEEYLSQFKSLLSPNSFHLLLKPRPSLFSFFKRENRSSKHFNEEELQPLYTLGEKLDALIEAASRPSRLLIRMAHDIEKRGNKTLLEKGGFSPDDLLKCMQRALAFPRFFTNVHERYRAVIIDEFQDTDAEQWDIFKRLFVNRPLEAFYIVGDPKQSIYSFRNADLDIYFQAKQSMQKIAQLTTNYRSEPQLLSSLNALFTKQSHFPYQIVNPDPQAENTRFTDGKNPLHFFIAKVAKKREKSWPSAEIESTYFFPFIANEIQHLTQKQEATFRDFAILVKDRYQATRLKHFLEALHIPIVSKSTESLTTSPLFPFFISFLKTLSSPKFVPQLLSHPLFELTHQQLKEDQTLLTHAAAFCHHLHSTYQVEGFSKALNAALHHEWKQDKTLFDLLVQKGQLDTYSDFMQLAEILIERSDQVKESPSELIDFLKELPKDKMKYCRRPLSDLNAVTIMTIHMSKGLEFPIVFALGLVSRYTSRQDVIRYKKEWAPFNRDHEVCQEALRDQERETLRGLYVALTRAKKRLYVPFLEETTKTIPPLGTHSAIELFFDSLPPLDVLMREINASYTFLEKTQSTPLKREKPLLQSPIKPVFDFKTHQIHSFSSLAKHTPPSSPKAADNDLPKGTETGLFFHFLLEKIIRERLTHSYQGEAIATLIRAHLRNTPYQIHEQTMITLIEKAFHFPLQGFCLADVSADHLYPETEFLYSQNQEESIKGFADLIFFYKDAYYILDWKTNLLESYSETSLEVAMKQHDYFLQADIYLEALKRYLTFKKDPHQIGGAYYLFLRGLSQNQGVYFISCGTQATQVIRTSNQ